MAARNAKQCLSARQVLSGYLLCEVIEPPSNAQHWNEGSARAGAAGVWRRNPAGDVSILSRTPTREKEKLDYLVLVSRTCFSCGFVDSGLTNLVFLWICGQTRQVIVDLIAHHDKRQKHAFVWPTKTCGFETCLCLVLFC